MVQRSIGSKHKGHPAKVKLARRLRGETTKTLKWIAQELHMFLICSIVEV